MITQSNAFHELHGKNLNHSNPTNPASILLKSKKLSRNSAKKQKNPCYQPKNPQNPHLPPVIFGQKGSNRGHFYEKKVKKQKKSEKR